MKALILAGGKGTRLAPYTNIIPKPLMPVGNQAIIEILLRKLIAQGFKEVTISVGYLHHLLEAYVGSIPDLNISLGYLHENEPLGTAGSLSLMKKPDDSFLVANGDVLTALNFNDLVAYHKDNKAFLTIASCLRTTKIDFGTLVVEGNKVLDYIEKPELQKLVSMGVYVYEPGVLDYIEPNRYTDFPQLVLRLLEAEEKVLSYEFTGFWLDIGRPDDFIGAQEVIDEMKGKLY